MRTAIVLTILCTAFVPAAAVHAAAPTDTSVEAAAHRLLELLADPSPAAAQALRERVDAGAPPGALMAMLDGYRSGPRIELADVVQQLARYRRSDVRGRAFAAWSELGGEQSDRAIAAAAVDLEPMIRHLAVALAARHPSPASERTIALLLARDPELAAELEDSEIELVPEDPQ